VTATKNDLAFIADLVLMRARDRCEYADFRFEEIESEHVSTSSRQVEPIEKSLSVGYAVRVLKDGAWGFAASCQFDLGEYERIVDTAIGIASASRLVSPAPVQLATTSTYHENYRTPIVTDPFTISLAEKVEQFFSGRN